MKALVVGGTGPTGPFLVQGLLARGFGVTILHRGEKIRSELGYRDVVSTEEGLRRTVAWLLANRPEPGGRTEQILGDTFDYDAEDQILAAQRDYEARLRAVR